MRRAIGREWFGWKPVLCGFIFLPMGRRPSGRHSPPGSDKDPAMLDDEKTRLELEAAAFRRLLEHLRSRTDVQNIDLMNLAGFCRNCLSNWLKEAADQRGIALSKDESRELIYGMRFDDWKAKYQKEASAAQLAAFEKASGKH
jgi:hypothetical protein